MMMREVVGHDPAIVQRRRVDVRPLRADDAALYSAFHAWLCEDRPDGSNRGRLPSPEDFPARVREDAKITIGALRHDPVGPKLLGIAHATCRPGDDVADLEIVLPSALQGRGLGRLLLGMLILCSRERGIRELVGDAPAEHRRMIELARAFRFIDAPSPTPGRVSLRLLLDDTPEL